MFQRNLTPLLLLLFIGVTSAFEVVAPKSDPPKEGSLPSPRGHSPDGTSDDTSQDPTSSSLPAIGDPKFKYHPKSMRVDIEKAKNSNDLLLGYGIIVKIGGLHQQVFVQFLESTDTSQILSSAYNSTKSPTFHSTTSGTQTSNYHEGNDTVIILSKSPTVDLLITDDPSASRSVLGLGRDSTFLAALKNLGGIDRNAWAFMDKSFDFGQPDRNRYSGDPVSYPLPSEDVSKHPVIKIKDLEVNGKTLMNGSAGFDAGVTVDWQQKTLLPIGVFTALAYAAGVPNNSTVDLGGARVLVTLDNGLQFNVTEGLVSSVAGGNSTGSGVPVIAPSWLKEVYLMVDYESGVAKLANTPTYHNTFTNNATAPTSLGMKISACVEWWKIAVGFLIVAALWL
ncbi:hypothetical protein K440DRAFT_641866 [Wilcoxina mikolae CBS 423.85]|nr:hypothetical protein K440DRAFT_641866 [Wilcoxina mikolae CBS 423.85]